jgi:hypothetical protein
MTYGRARGKMISAVWRMSNSRKDNIIVPAREYAWIRGLAVTNLRELSISRWSDESFKQEQLKRLSSPDRRQHLSIKMGEIRRTEDARTHQQQIMIKRFQGPDYAENHAAKMKVINADPQKRSRQSNTNKQLWTEEKRHDQSTKMTSVRNRTDLVERQRQINQERYKDENERALQRTRLKAAYEANPQLKTDKIQGSIQLWASRSADEIKEIGAKISTSNLASIEAGESHMTVIHTCPHCGKIGKGPIMKRHHFDKCKSKPTK